MRLTASFWNFSNRFSVGPRVTLWPVHLLVMRTLGIKQHEH